MMPRIEIDRAVKVNLNTVLIFGQFLAVCWALFSGVLDFASTNRTMAADTAKNTKEIARLQRADDAITQRVTEAQEKTASRLSSLETQGVYILQSINRIETTVADLTTSRSRLR